MYLTISDIQSSIPPEVLAVITRSQDNLDTLVREAIHFADSYLCQRYDTAAEWAKSGADRQPVVVKVVKDIAIYYCLQAHGMADISEPRLRAYDEAVAWLEAVRGEKVSVPGLQRLSVGSGSNYVAFGGNKPRKNQF